MSPVKALATMIDNIKGGESGPRWDYIVTHPRRRVMPGCNDAAIASSMTDLHSLRSDLSRHLAPFERFKEHNDHLYWNKDTS
jgi:hypothetical protein